MVLKVFGKPGTRSDAAGDTMTAPPEAPVSDARPAGAEPLASEVAAIIEPTRAGRLRSVATGLAALFTLLIGLPVRSWKRLRRQDAGQPGLRKPVRLPKLLALAVSGVMVAAGGSALAVAQTTGGSHAAAGKLAITGVAPASAQLPIGSTGSVGSVGSAASVTTARRSSTTAPAASGDSIVQGLSVPVGGLPLSVNQNPAQTGGTAPHSASGPAVTIPTPSAASLPKVAGVSKDRNPDAVVMLSSPLTASQITSLSHLAGVVAIETVDSGTVTMGGSPVVAFGVDPGTFRNFTPAASAASDQLWRYLAGGSLVSSYEMADDRGLKLGSDQTIVPSALAPDSSVKGWLGGFASIGLPGVDLLIDHKYSPQFGLTPDSGLVVVAPGLSGAKLQSELQSAVPDGAVELLYPGQLPTNLPGNILTGTVRQKIIAAALTRIGLPYVWGGAGPDNFDCSGLVQWSYRQAGILMPRVADQQFLTGNHIPLADAQPGDLVFWAYDPSDPGYIDHVGIYLGNGTMVVAPHTGTNVQIAPVTSNDFAGAVEVVLANR